MAKRKKKTQPEESLDPETIKKLQLETFLKRFKTANITNKKRLVTGLFPLDRVLDGGIVLGSILEVFGTEGAGKTTLALVIAKAFRKIFPGKRVLYVDAEHALDLNWAAKHGISFSTDGQDGDIVMIQPMSANEAMDAVVDGAAHHDLFSLVIFDSIPALMAEEELNTAKTEHTTTSSVVRGVLPKLVTTMVRRLVPAIGDSEMTVLWINQIRAKMDMYGGGITTPGGYARQHAAHYRIQLSAKSMKPSDNAREITIKTVKNKHGRPYLEDTMYIFVNEGLSIINNNILAAEALGIIEKAGSYYKLSDGSSIHGRQALIEYYYEHPKEFTKLQHELYKFAEENVFVNPAKPVYAFQAERGDNHERLEKIGSGTEGNSN